MPTAPAFLQYAPADILKMGQERGLPPEQIAQAVTRHRDNIAAYGQQMHGDAFMQEGMPRLQQDTNTALEKLKPGFGIGDTLSGIGSMLGGLPTTVPAAYYGVTEGLTRPDQYSPEARAAFDANAAYQQRMQQESQQRLERGAATSTGDAFRSAGPSLGGTVGSMAAAIPAGMAAGALVGTAIEPGGGTVGGGLVGAAASGIAAAAGAGTVAYRMAGQQFLDDAFTALQKQRGGQMSEQEKQQAYNELLPLAQNNALWEAGPEAIGNAVTLGTAKIVFGLGKPLLTNLAKTALGKAGVKVGAIAGNQVVELGGETATALGQGVTQAQSDAYARGDANWQQASSPYDRPGGTLQAFKDIAPATLALGATALGAGGVVKAASLPFKPNAPLPPTQTATPTPTPPNAGASAQMGASADSVPSTLSRIAAESVAPEEDTGALSAQDIPQGMGQPMSDPSLTPLTPGERAPADQTAPDAIAGVTAAPAQTFTGSNAQTGAEMPVPSPTAEAGAGTGAMGDSQLDGLQTREVPLDTLGLSKDVPQFKSDANESGVVEPLAGKYERLGTGPVLIWERLNGQREVISGRHRFDLAKRTGEKTIPGQIVREADGFTLQHALTADAELNIRDGHGKTKDFANYFRNSGITDAEAESRGLRARAAQRAGWAIGTSASPAVFDLHQNGKLTDAQAEALATTAPGNEALQRAGIAALNRGTPIDVTVNLLKAMALEVGAAPTPDQMDLFGADDSAMLRMEEQARKATEIQRTLKEQVAAVQGAAKRPDKAKALGVNVKDPAGVQKKVDAIRAELYRWESWPLHADLREQVRGPSPVPSLPFSPSPSLDSLLTGTESTRPLNVGETARAQNADPLGELMGAKLAGEAEQAQGKMEALFLPKNFTGNAQAGLAKAAAQNQSLLQRGRGAEGQGSLLTAYQSATRGSSSAMVPIRAVYEQARAQNPALTPAQFMQEVQAGDAAGTVLLEPFDTPQGLQAAGEFVARNASGVPSINMMVTEQPSTTANNGQPRSTPLQSPAELAAATAANSAKLAALGLPTKPGTRIWARGKVQAALGRIAKDTSYPATMRAMAELLQKVNLDNLLLKIEADGRLNFAGKYQPYNDGRGEISLNTRVTGRGDTDIVQSLVHELLHHATFRALRSPKNATQRGAIKDLEALRKRALAALSAQELGSQYDYELSNTDEFIAALFTRPDFQTALAGIPLENAPTLGQRIRSVLDEIFRVLGELVTGKQVQPGSVLEASFAATLRLMGEGQGNPAQAMPALLNPAEDPQMRENRSRMALSEEDQRMYEVQGNDIMLAEAEQWLAGVDNETAVRQIESGLPPAGLRTDHLPALTERTLQRLVQATTGANEIERLKAEALLDRASTAHQDIINRERGRGLQQVGAASDRLAAIMPIMGAKKVLIDRADAVVKQRFNGGAQGVKAKIEKILADADLDISERVERILATVMQSALKPITSIKDAVAALMPGKSQREQMIEDVAQALMVKARGNVVTPERKTALAALAASLKQTLGASVQGDAKKAATSPLGEVLARAFVDQVSEGPLFTEAWQAGRQSVFDMFYDMELDRAFHPARIRAEQAAARLKQLEAGSTEQQAASATERAELKTTLAELKAEMQTAKAKADGMTDTFWQQVGKLMPATPTMAYAPGMSKEAIKRGFEMAGYTAEIKTGMKQDGTRTLNVQDALRDPKRAMQAVLNVWDAEAQAAGIDPAAWQEGRKLAWQALNETLNEWQTKANERAAKLAQAQKDALMAKDSPALVKLLKLLAGKIAPGMDWTEIFTDLQGTQKARQLAIYERLMKDERLQSLTQDERIALTNELDKAWMRERRTVFNRELQKAGILGEKKASDRLKVKNAMPKLLRLINLGMFNSEMFREVIAPEYNLRVIDAKTAATLRGLAEAAYAQPEGVLRNRKLGALLTAMQSATGSTLAELVNNYWTAAVLSGTRTQFDTWMAGTNGLGTNLIQAAGLLVRGRGKDAVAAHAAWWRGLIDGTRESLQILAKGDYSVLKRFGADLNKAMMGESNFRPLPLGESLWKNGTTFQKYAMAPVMIWTGRLMAAADHINNTATTAGAMAVARALHPEYYGRTTFSEIDQANARAQALREVTGGSEPTTAADKATVSVRVRELLYGSMREPERLEANEIGDMAAFQNDPTGIFGTVYAAMKAGLGTVQRAMDEKSQDMAANAATRAMAGLLAGSLHGLTGTRFMRFGFNFGAELTRYVPGTSLMDRYTGRALYGQETGPMQRELTLGKNVVGLMLGSTLAALFLSSDDDDEGWQIEGDWSLLTPQQVKERMSAGLERLTMWKRDGDKVRRVSYKQWPTMGLFAVVGGMLDEKRHKPEKWAQHGTTGHLLRGMGTGMLQIKNVSAVRNLVEIFGGTRLGGDPSTGIIDDVLKVGTNFAGGFVPTAIKDAEIWNDPRNFKAEGWAEELQRSMPIARRFVNDGRPQLNLLGEEVKLQRAPWSRGYTSVESGEAGRVLGALLGRGLNLPQPSDAVMVYQNGVKVPLEKLGREKVWQYEKAVGTAYKAWLATEGSALLQMPVKQADKVIEQRATAIKRQALARVTR